MKTRLWMIVICISVGGGVWLGWNLKGDCPDPSSSQTTKTQTKVVEKVVEKRPDGTIVETEVVKDIQADIKKDQVDKPAKKEYNIGVEFSTDFDHQPSYKDLEVSVGKRIVGDIWGEASYDIGERRVGVGLRLEF